jgi:penicillin-binding protein 1A
MIVATARRFGIRSPLPDTPSLPIGADEVNVLEHTVAYATFPNKGMAVTPHAILEVRSGTGDTIWRFDRDGKKPTQAISPQVASDMALMMSKVVEEGTAKRAILDGIKAAGKTGTTNSYRDAWFVGYTGNFVCGVWFGNDDYSPLNRMTGGSLPAQTWHEIMAYAHQGVELKNITGVGPNGLSVGPILEGNKNEALRPVMLTNKGVQALLRVERLMDEAGRAMVALPAASDSPAPASPAATQPPPKRADGKVGNVAASN